MSVKGNVVQVCMAIHDSDGKYCRYAGAALGSLFMHTQRQVCVHLLHDKTLSEDNRQKFVALADQAGQEVCFYHIDIGDKMRLSVQDKGILSLVSEASLFRLYIPEILPKELDLIIYLDADIIVNMDIGDLWDWPMEKAWMAGRVDSNKTRSGHPLLRKGVISSESYVNAGVMIWNLNDLRCQLNLANKAIRFFQEEPDSCFMDQDAINYLAQGHISLLPERFNTFTDEERKLQEVIGEKIYHFAGDKPHMVDVENIDCLYYEQLLHTPWGSKEDMLQILYESMEAHKQERERRNVLDKVLRRIHNRKLAIWGAKSILTESVLPLIAPVDGKTGICIDNDADLYGSYQHGFMVRSPEFIWKDDSDKYYIVVLSVSHYKDIRIQLESNGFVEWVDFCDGRQLLFEKDGGYQEVK